MSVECLPNGTLVYIRKLEDGNGMTEYGLEYVNHLILLRFY